MEIRVKTATEFHDSHVTIEIRAADVSEAALVAERLYTAAQVGDAQASEAELVAAPLREELSRRAGVIKKLENKVEAERERNDELEEELISQRERNDELEEELASERQRATENREWAESRVASAGLKLADAQRAIDILSGQLGRVSGAVHSPDLQAAMRTTWETKTAGAMKEAIQAVRDALGSPSLPTPPGRATSQA